MSGLAVVDQVVTACRPQNRVATLLGALLGGFVPVATYVVAHQETTSAPLWTQLPALLVLGGLAYSALTVYRWARMAVGHAVKAAGFVVLLEGVMVASSTPWLGLVALGYLVGINAIATGCQLSLDRVKKPRVVRASGRRAAKSGARLRAVVGSG